MRTLIAPALALLAALAGRAQANDLYGYYDIIIPEAVGEIDAKTYDLSAKVGKDDNRFIGNQVLKGGQYVGAGFGLHVLVVHDGLLLGGEASISGGRIQGAEAPWAAMSEAMHYSMMLNVGYALSLGERVMIHGAGVLGFDGMQLEVAGPMSGVATLTGGDGQPIQPLGYHLERHDLRLGLTGGVHFNIAKFVAIWADGEIDTDGQWRARGGLAFGAPYNARF
jgi:hypothetical protein